jgi:leucyl/phenylalanyl-tRNA---protein transferase
VHPLDPDLLLRAYAAGIFPMADGRDADELFWVEPRKRGVLPLEAFHLPRSLAKLLRQERFELTADRAFERVMRACAEPAPGRRDTWINEAILDGYSRLHRLGFAHSLECWKDGALAGGLYGVKLGAAFFGESMFSRMRDASKVALAHLIARLRVGGFRLLDTQFLTDHLARFGAVEVPRAAYRASLDAALSDDADFFALDALSAGAARPATMVSGPVSGKLIAQLLTQTS